MEEQARESEGKLALLGLKSTRPKRTREMTSFTQRWPPSSRSSGRSIPSGKAEDQAPSG